MAPTISDLYSRVSRVIPPIEWAVFEEDVEAILKLKKQRGAIVLAHNYQTPEIFHCVSDIVGDSLHLAREAEKSSANVIVMAGVYFMAETAKLLNPSSVVLIPDLRAGCSLAESITAEDVRTLRSMHPGVPVVAYVNTSAAVKSEADICCTSGNAKKVVESLGAPEVIMVPDEFLARNVAKETSVRIIDWKGHCMVHERFTATEIRQLRKDYPGVVVLAHPECPPDVVEESDLAGSTAMMSRYVDERRPARIALITECSMSDNIAASHPEVELLRPCNLCPHMKRITLGGIRRSLETMTHEVVIDREIAGPARRSVERMLAI